VVVVGWGGDTVWGAAVGGNDDAGANGYDGGLAFGWGVWTPGVEVVPKSPMMSSTVDLCCWGGGEDVVDVADEEPKISARRSWFDWADAVG